VAETPAYWTPRSNRHVAWSLSEWATIYAAEPRKGNTLPPRWVPSKKLAATSSNLSQVRVYIKMTLRLTISYVRIGSYSGLLDIVHALS